MKKREEKNRSTERAVSMVRKQTNVEALTYSLRVQKQKSQTNQSDIWFASDSI